jgi:hypothetical protein
MVRAMRALLGVLLLVHTAHASPVVGELSAGVDAARYDWRGLTSGPNGGVETVFAPTFRLRGGVPLDEHWLVQVRASYATSRDASYNYIDDLGLPTVGNTEFTVVAVGAGVEYRPVDRAWLAPWIGDVHFAKFSGDVTDDHLGYGLEGGYDVIIQDNLRGGLTAGVSHSAGLTSAMLGISISIR